MKRNRVNRIAALVLGGIAGIGGTWGLYPIRSSTFPDLLVSTFPISFKMAAFIVSMLVAVLATGALSLFTTRGT